jgi:hypothetical protein
MIKDVALEKLLRAKFAKIKSRQDALQTTFSIFLDIFYAPIFDCFEKNRLFQHPRTISFTMAIRSYSSQFDDNAANRSVDDEAPAPLRQEYIDPV